MFAFIPSVLMQHTLTLTVVESIRLFLTLTSATFVREADDQAITAAVSNVSGVEDRQRHADHVENAVQIPFAILVRRFADITNVIHGGRGRFRLHRLGPNVHAYRLNVRGGYRKVDPRHDQSADVNEII